MCIDVSSFKHGALYRGRRHDYEWETGWYLEGLLELWLMTELSWWGFQRVAGHELVPVVDKQCNIYRANTLLENDIL